MCCPVAQWRQTLCVLNLQARQAERLQWYKLEGKDWVNLRCFARDVTRWQLCVITACALCFKSWLTTLALNISCSLSTKPPVASEQSPRGLLLLNRKMIACGSGLVWGNLSSCLVSWGTCLGPRHDSCPYNTVEPHAASTSNLRVRWDSESQSSLLWDSHTKLFQHFESVSVVTTLMNH